MVVVGSSILVILLGVLVALIVSLIIMFSSSIASSVYGAPFIPISKKLVKRLLDFGGLSKGDIFYDLGSGDGRVLLSAIKEFKVKKATGYEVTLWPYLDAKFSAWLCGLSGKYSWAGGKLIEIKRQNFFKADFSGATFVYMYLFPKLVNRLADKIARECLLHTKILCPGFPIDLASHPGFKLLKTEKFGKITAYLYALTPT